MFTILKSGTLADVWKNFCSVEYKWFEQIFLLFLHLNCLLVDHLAIIRMWFSVIPLWLLTSVPCCGSEVFSGTMSRLHWLWFSVSTELVLSNVISPHFSLLRKEISKKKNIEFRRQHIHMFLTWLHGGEYWEPRKAYMYCCVAVVRLGNMVKIYVIRLFYFLFKICTIGIFFSSAIGWLSGDSITFTFPDMISLAFALTLRTETPYCSQSLVMVGLVWALAFRTVWQWLVDVQCPTWMRTTFSSFLSWGNSGQLLMPERGGWADILPQFLLLLQFAKWPLGLLEPAHRGEGWEEA